MGLTERQINKMTAPDWHPSVRLCVHGVTHTVVPDDADAYPVYVMVFLGHMLMDDSEMDSDAPIPDHRLMTLHMMGSEALWEQIRRAWFAGRRDGLECQKAIDQRGEMTDIGEYLEQQPDEPTDWRKYRDDRLYGNLYHPFNEDEDNG